MIKNKEDLIKQCNNVFDMFSLHNWHYPFILDWEDKGDRLLSFIGNIRNYYDDTKDEITLAVKEIEILKNERLNKYCISVGALIDYIKNEDEDGWMIEKVKNWNMTYSELQEFKSKLERLMP